MAKVKFLFITIMVTWVLIGCGEVTIAPTLTPSEVATLGSTATVSATPTDLPTDTTTPTETSTPTTPRLPTATPTLTVTPTPVESPIITPFPTPTRIFQGYPYRTPAGGINYIPRSKLRLRDCPYLDDIQCGWHDHFTTTLPTPVYCIQYNDTFEIWASPDTTCMVENPVTWFAIQIGTTIFADEAPGPKGN